MVSRPSREVGGSPAAALKRMKPADDATLAFLPIEDRAVPENISRVFLTSGFSCSLLEAA